MTRNAFISLSIALLLFIATIAGYWMWYASVSALSGRAATLASEVQSKNTDIARIAEAKTALSALSSEEATLRHYFVSTNNIVSFLEELQATGKSLGTHVTVVSVASDDTGSAPHLNLSLRIEGTFDAVTRTLGAIEYAARDIVVTDMTLGVSGKDNWVATGMFTVGTRKPDANQLPAAPAPGGAGTTSVATTTP